MMTLFPVEDLRNISHTAFFAWIVLTYSWKWNITNTAKFFLCFFPEMQTLTGARDPLVVANDVHFTRWMTVVHELTWLQTQ